VKDSEEENIANAEAKKLITKGDTKIKVKKPGEVSTAEDAIAKVDSSTLVGEENVAPSVAMHDSLNNIAATALIDSVATVKKDTAITAAKKNKKTTKNHQWHYGVELTSGTSNVKNNLFNNGSVYTDAFSSTIGFPGSGTPVNPEPNKPTVGIGLIAGIYAEKNINPNWKFKTGLNYMYQSNNIKVGNKVDSSINFRVDVNKNLTASSYYHIGNSTSYKNKFHLVEIPLVFQYQFPRSSRFYIEAGPSLTYLLRSNAVVYSPGTKAYVTDKNIFNKFGVSLNGGMVINFAQNSTLPFSIGYQFKYGVGSVVKTSFGKQHFINSFLYLKIPFKK